MDVAMHACNGWLSSLPTCWERLAFQPFVDLVSTACDHYPKDIWYIHCMIYDIWYIPYDIWYVHCMIYPLYDIWYILYLIFAFRSVCIYRYACTHVINISWLNLTKYSTHWSRAESRTSSVAILAQRVKTCSQCLFWYWLHWTYCRPTG